MFDFARYEALPCCSSAPFAFARPQDRLPEMAQSLITPVELYLRLLETDENAHVELIDGEVMVHASPDVAHSFGASGVGAELYIRYQRGRGGPGGWRVLDEVDVLLSAWEQAFRPDLAGWR